MPPIFLLGSFTHEQAEISIITHSSKKVNRQNKQFLYDLFSHFCLFCLLHFIKKNAII